MFSVDAQGVSQFTVPGAASPSPALPGLGGQAAPAWKPVPWKLPGPGKSGP